MDTESIFTNIYKNNLWGDGESVSGPGSNQIQTSQIQTYLPKLLKGLEIETLLDVGCGDFNWMKNIVRDYSFDYTGIDIVEELINSNNQKFSNERTKFVKGDISTTTLPKVDLILCRDVLFHLTIEQIQNAIRNFVQSRSHYLLTTTFLTYTENAECEIGSWRPINFTKPPFNFPHPIITLNEGFFKEIFSDKSLCLWDLKNLELPNNNSLTQ